MDVTQATVQERRIGFVFQSYALFNHMTVAENIAFGIRIRKLPIDADARYFGRYGVHNSLTKCRLRNLRNYQHCREAQQTMIRSYCRVWPQCLFYLQGAGAAEAD